MFNRAIYATSFILFLLAFVSCQESTTEPEIMNGDVKILLRDGGGESQGDVDVAGIVYKGSNPVNGATVKLYKGGNYLDQTTTDINGHYMINICGHNQGAGTYTVKATKYYHGDEWCDSENFYWDGGPAPLLIKVDLYLILCARGK